MMSFSLSDVSRRRAALAIAAALGGIVLYACGAAPNSPGGVPTPPISISPGSGPAQNSAPVIESIAVSSERTEIDGEITVTADVKDVETPLDQLRFEWKADQGTFSGEGASVKWRAPKGIATPADFPLTLTVTETYGVPDVSGVRPQNVATATSAPIRVHDSPKELGDMSLRFLSNFANSPVSTSTCLKEFSDSCRGKADEKIDIDNNRAYYLILSSSLDLKSVSIGSSRSFANMTVACAFTSRIVSCSPSNPASPACSAVGSIESVKGNCNLTGVYEQKRWWLCDSTFAAKGLLPASMRGFFGRPPISVP